MYVCACADNFTTGCGSTEEYTHQECLSATSRYIVAYTFDGLVFIIDYLRNVGNLRSRLLSLSKHQKSKLGSVHIISAGMRFSGMEMCYSHRKPVRACSRRSRLS